MDTTLGASELAGRARLRSYRRSKRTKPCNACRQRRVACVRQRSRSCAFCTRRNLECIVEDDDALSPTQNATQRSEISPGTVDHGASQSTQHIGPTSDHDNFILRHWVWVDSNGPANCTWSRRRLDTNSGNPVHSAAFPDDHLDAHPAYYPKDTISGAVASCQAELMEMYFEHVHPAFAILGPQRPSSISSSLTLRASIYALALQHCPTARDIDPWIFTDFNKQALNIERQAPKLETIEAALLFAQRHAHVLRAPTMPGMSAEIGSIVGMAHDLGLNIDPVHWDISEHEKRRRKRLWWGVFMLDKWNALTLGRPSFLVDHQSNHSQPTLSDFAEDCSSTPPPKDRNAALQFIAMAGLTRILSKIMTYYFSVQSDLEDVDSLDTMPAFSKFEEELQHWSTQSLAPLLAEKAFPDPTGSFEIAYYTTQVTLYRGVLRELTSRSSPTDQFWEYLSQQSKTVALSIINLLEYLPVARSSTFWWATSKLNFSIVGSFMIRMYLSSTSTDARRFWMGKFNFYRKLLQAHSPGRGITTHALLRLDLLTNGQELKDSGTDDDYFVAPLIAANDIFSDTLSLSGFFVD